MEESSTSGDSAEPEKVPFHLLERTIKSFIETTLPHQLSRLRTHQARILQLQREQSWEKLNDEQINANRSVKHLQDTIKALEDLRSQVREEDLQRFEVLVEGIKLEIVSTIDAYGMVKCSSTASVESHDLVTTQFEELTVDEQSALIPKEEAAVKSWEDLREELLQLDELMKMLSKEVKDQRKLISNIEEHVDCASTNISGGTVELKQASRLRLLILPVGGALVGGVIGGVVGGPIGAFAGLKVGALAAAAAGTAGAVGGGYLGYKQKVKIEQTEDKKEQ